MLMEIVPAVAGLLVAGTVVQAMELFATARGPRCPKCVHCRLEAAHRAEAERMDEAARAARRWGLDDADDDEGGPKA